MTNPENTSSWRVGKTQSTGPGVGGQYGFGFNIQNRDGAPVLTISYATEAAAEEAEIVIRKAIENAVNSPATKRHSRLGSVQPTLLLF